MATETFEGRTATGLGPDFTWSTKTAGWSTGSGVAFLSSEDVEAVELCGEDSGSDDHAVEVVYNSTASASYNDIGLNLRAGSSGASPARYCVKRGRSSGLTSGFYEVRRYGGAGSGDVTYLRTATALAFVAGETFRAEVEGDEIRVYRNGTLIDTVTDSTITSGHFGGLDGYRSTLGSSTRVELASWSIEAIGGGSPDQNISPTGIASTAAFGTPTLAPGAVTVSPSGVASTVAFGALNLSPGSVTVGPAGVASTVAFGSVTLAPGSVTITPAAVASTVAFGTPTVSGTGMVHPSGVASSAMFGQPTITLAVSPSGIASTAAAGTPTLTATPVSVSPGGVASTVAFGTPDLVPGSVAVRVEGVASALAFGTPTVTIEAGPPPSERTTVILAEPRGSSISSESRRMEVL